MYPDDSFINSSTCFTLLITFRKDYMMIVGFHRKAARTMTREMSDGLTPPKLWTDTDQVHNSSRSVAFWSRDSELESFGLQCLMSLLKKLHLG